MRLRRLVLTLLLVASATLAGCAGSDSSPSPTPEATTAEPTLTDTTATPTADATEHSPTASPLSRLVVRAHGVETLTVTLWNTSMPEGDPVYSLTFRRPDGSLWFDHVFERRVSYHLVIRANGTIVVNRTLHASQGYEVSVTPNGTEVATVVS